MTILLFVFYFSLFSLAYTEHRDILLHNKCAKMTVRQLKATLKARGHKGYSKLKKSQLIQLCLQG